MQKVFCALRERFVNPLFEVFDGGDFILSSYRDVEEPLAQAQIFFPEAGRVDEAKAALRAALGVLAEADPAFTVPEIETAEVPDEDWRFSYRRHFRTERVGRRLVVHPPWEPMPEGGVVITLDPGLAFGTGKHETTRACLEYIDELADAGGSMLDMGCGSGILSIAAAKLGYAPVEGFDVDPEAVEASRANAALNGADAAYRRHALGGGQTGCAGTRATYDLVVANILGPLLIRFADEIAPRVGRHLVISGILADIYPEVLAAYTPRGFREVSRKTLGEWTTGLLAR